MRPRNEALHAEVQRACDLKEQIESSKTIANRCKTTPEVVRVMICREMKRRKLTNVMLHVEQSDAMIAASAKL